MISYQVDSTSDICGACSLWYLNYRSKTYLYIYIFIYIVIILALRVDNNDNLIGTHIFTASKITVPKNSTAWRGTTFTQNVLLLKVLSPCDLEWLLRFPLQPLKNKSKILRRPDRIFENCITIYGWYFKEWNKRSVMQMGLELITS